MGKETKKLAISKDAELSVKRKINKVCVGVCVLSASAHSGQRHLISWSCLKLELISGPLEELGTLQTAEASLQT